MPFISDAQLTALRTTAYKGLDTEVTIERPTQIETAYGSEPGFTTIGTTLAWVREMSNSAVGSIVGVLGVVESYRVHFPWDTDIKVGDRLEINGEHLEVNDLNELNTIRIFTTAICRRVK